MSKTPKSGKKWIVKAGSIIKIDGLPYTVTTDTIVHGFRKPEWPEEGLTPKFCGSADSPASAAKPSATRAESAAANVSHAVPYSDYADIPYGERDYVKASLWNPDGTPTNLNLANPDAVTVLSAKAHELFPRLFQSSAPADQSTPQESLGSSDTPKKHRAAALFLSQLWEWLQASQLGQLFCKSGKFLKRSYFVLSLAFLFGCSGPYQKAEMTPGFILLLICVYIVGHFSARLLLSWAEACIVKIEHKRFWKRLGTTDAELEETRKQFYEAKYQLLLDKLQVIKDRAASEGRII